MSVRRSPPPGADRRPLVEADPLMTADVVCSLGSIFPAGSCAVPEETLTSSASRPPRGLALRVAPGRDVLDVLTAS